MVVPVSEFVYIILTICQYIDRQLWRVLIWYFSSVWSNAFFVVTQSNIKRHMMTHWGNTIAMQLMEKGFFYRMINLSCISKHFVGMTHINLQDIRKYILWRSCSQCDNAFTTKVILKATCQHTLGKHHNNATNAGRIFHRIINLNLNSNTHSGH